MAIKGDFISFTYNGVHSTDLGVMRVTSSNRYTDALLPTIQDKTVQVPGSNGTYFFGSYYTQRPITINAVFDDVSESQIRLMRKVFGDQLSHELIFDDEPYKVYYAKATGTPQLQYIPFSSPRIYKGEGTFTFTCFEPFAHTPNSNKYLSQYVAGHYNYTSVSIDETTFNSNKTNYYIKVEDNYIQCTNESTFDDEETYYTKSYISSNPSWYKYDNKEEWNLSANLLSTKGVYDAYNSTTGFTLYNPGDIEADFKVIIPIPAGDNASFSINGIEVVNNNTGASRILSTSAISAGKGEDVAIQFNSKTNLIEGLDAHGARTGNLYNENITTGNWFKIPLTTDGLWNFQLIDYTNTSSIDPQLVYDYLYF